MDSIQYSSMISENKTAVAPDVVFGFIFQIHSNISKLESLEPSETLNSLFAQLVKLCISIPSSIDIGNLPPEVQTMRQSLIRLIGRAECLLELQYSNILINTPRPLDNLELYPYHSKYVTLSGMENRILFENGVVQPKKVAFIGSGPVPLSSIMLATRHWKSAHFVNFDIDEAANDMARRLVATDAELSRRMTFETCDVMQMKENLGEFDCIFLATLVGMSKEDKVKILGHVRKYMKAGGHLLVRSVKGVRGFMYPVIEEDDLAGFEVLSAFHPGKDDDVVCSVILLQKPIA